MKKLFVFLLLGGFAWTIGRSADYLIAAYIYVADHRVVAISVISVIFLIVLAFRCGPRLIKKYKARNDIYLNIDDDHVL